MKAIITIIFMFLPLLSYSQSNDSIVVYNGYGFFGNKIIDLSNKDLTKIPVIDMDVEVLILDNNKLTELPDWFMGLTHLRSLSVRDNELVDVSVLMYCESLQELYLTNNPDLAKLPRLTGCEKLKIVDVIHTQINELPLSIRRMNNLAYFKYSVPKR